MTEIVCWQCGASLKDFSLPLSRRDQCRQCGADLHVCKLCSFYDTSRSKSCYETVVDEVREKEAANFCDYFKVRADAFDSAADQRTRRAQADLDALFGGEQAGVGDATTASNPLDDLFKKD